ncbi:MAG: LysM domain-containing protein [Chloroflexota bacterium]|nr:LysM domain-containing protein [Chloroflexota bacterium]
MSVQKKQVCHLVGIILLIFPLIGCQPRTEPSPPSQDDVSEAAQEETYDIIVTPLPERPHYEPGQLVDYIVQSGDTLPALAVRFNTRVDEILEANPIIPTDVTTLPPGMPMKIPVYYMPFWGTPFQIIPDSLFVNGPAQVGFDTQTFVDEHPGWLREYSDYVGEKQRSGAGIIDYVATNFSISPRFLLALLEYQTGALSQASLPPSVDEKYPLGHEDRRHRRLYMQLVWAANMLNDGYYAWRTGHLTTLELLDGIIERPDPWQNAASVTLQHYYSQFHSGLDYQIDIGPEGFAQTYRDLFGDPWLDVQPHIPGSLEQPQMLFPFEAGETWAYTGGPHTGWGTGEPWAAIDFAPPSVMHGCITSNEWNTAMAAGVVARSETGIVELDLDGDGDPRTGWVIFHLHVATRDRVPLGKILQAGDHIGHPSCEGGTSTGTHIHIVRKYNGEWVPAGGVLAFNLEGWIVHNGTAPYQGTMTRFSRTVVASDAVTREAYVTAAER